MSNKKIRKAELEQFKPIYLTRETHALLKQRKKELVKLGKGKSMARILNDLIIKEL